MIKKLIFKIIKSIVMFGLDYLYMYIDTNKDGKLDKKELEELYKKIKRIRK